LAWAEDELRHSCLKSARDYSAIDYSPPLVDAVKRKYGIRSAYVCDVRNMTVLTDADFDFVLFSFNGLDCVDHAGRIKALREIHRVLNRGAYSSSLPITVIRPTLESAHGNPASIVLTGA